MVRTIGVLLLVLGVTACAVHGTGEDDFRSVPYEDLLLSLGAAASAPDGIVSTELILAIDVAPFFTTSETGILLLPAFAASQSLETGLAFNLWSASVDVELDLSPWALNSTGGWIEFHPPAWILAQQPDVTVDGSIGWGPRWSPTGDWTHASGAGLDLSVGWEFPTVWDSGLTISVTSSSTVRWTMFAGPVGGRWTLEARAESFLPLFAQHPEAVRGSVHTKMDLLPTFGLAFDIELEFRAGAFYAYAVVGAGAGGVRAEVGGEVSIGL